MVVCGLVLAASLFLPQPNSPQAQPAAAADTGAAAASVDLLAEQERHAKADWQAAAAALAAAESGQNATNKSGDGRALEKQLSETTALLRTTQLDLQSHQERIAAIQERIADSTEQLVPPEGETVPVPPAEAKKALELLESQEQELAARLTDSHPKLTAVRQQIADLKAALANPPQPGAAASTTPSADREALAQSLLAEQKQASALHDKERALSLQQRQQWAALAAQPAGGNSPDGDAAQIEQLRQQAKLAAANHREAAERLKQAQLQGPVAAPQLTATKSPPRTLRFEALWPAWC